LDAAFAIAYSYNKDLAERYTADNILAAKVRKRIIASDSTLREKEREREREREREPQPQQFGQL